MLSPEEKIATIQPVRRHDTDTGSPEVQIALLTTRIAQLTEHLKAHRKDYDSRRGLFKMVGQRKKLLSYLRRVDGNKHRALVAQLGLRD